MNPNGNGSNGIATRRAWRVMSALALLLGSASLFLNVMLFRETTDNRVKGLTYTCEQIERVKLDGRQILEARGVDPESLPRHPDGSYPFQPINESCRTRALRVVNPRHEP